MKVELNDSGFFINGQEVVYPTNSDALALILGEPTRKVYEHNDWRSYWDDLGVYASGIDITSIMFLVERQEGFKFPTEKLFEGEVIVNGKPIEDYAESSVKVGRYQVRQARFRGEKDNPIFSYTLGINFDYEEEVDASKYKPKPINGEALVFADFNFKLAVIQELMYTQKLLTPTFDVHEFIKLYKDRAIDYNKEGYEPIPEVVEYFKKIEIDSKFAKNVTSVYEDGGNDIYMNIAPLWGGDESFFDIKSFEDVALFPNLKEMTLLKTNAAEAALDSLEAKGIAVNWL